MLPIKYTTLFKEVSMKTGCDEKLVRDIVEYYWSELKKNMIEGKAHSIMITGFGMFSIKTNKLDITLEKYHGQLKHIKPTTFQRKQIIEEIKHRIEVLERIKASKQLEKDKWEITKQRRYGGEYKNNT